MTAPEAPPTQFAAKTDAGEWLVTVFPAVGYLAARAEVSWRSNQWDTFDAPVKLMVEAVMGPSAEKDALACPLCHGAAYLCTEPHTDGRGARIHCRAASLHNFMPDDPRILPPASPQVTS